MDIFDQGSYRSSVRRALCAGLGAFLVTVLPTSCDSGGGSGSEGAGESGIAPREILTPELVRSVFPVADAPLSFREGAGSKHHPSWVAAWPVPNVEEVKAANAEAIQAYMKAKIAGEEVGPIPVPHLQNEVRLTLFGKAYADTAAALNAFGEMVAFMKKGITPEVEVQGKKVSATFRFEYDQEVEGVGERAAWCSKLHQLSAVAGRRIFHLVVDLGDDEENLRLAKQAAGEIAAALKE